MARAVPGILDFSRIGAAIDSFFGTKKFEDKETQQIQDILDIFKNLPEERRKAREDAYKLFGISATQGKLTDVDMRIAQFEASVDLTEEALRSSGGVINIIIEGNVARLQRQAQITRRMLFAEKSAFEGEFQRASTLAESAIQDATQDQITRLEGMKFVLGQTQNQLSRADQKRAEAFNFALEERSRKLQEELQMKQEKAQLFLQLQAQFPRANLNPSMTLDEMFNQVKPFATEREQLDLASARLDLEVKRAQIASSNRANREGITVPSDIQSLVNAVRSGTMSVQDAAKLAGKSAPAFLSALNLPLNDDQIREYIRQDFSLGKDLDAMIKELYSPLSVIPSSSKERYEEILRERFNQSISEEPGLFENINLGFQQNLQTGNTSMQKWATGFQQNIKAPITDFFQNLNQQLSEFNSSP